MAPTSPCLPSLLLATSTTGLLARRAKSAKARSLGVSPARASITNISASARPIAVSVCSCIRAVSEPLAPSSRPAVSITVNSRSPRRALPSAVAGDAGLVIHQRQLLPDQPVEQRRLADIGPADDGNR